MRASSWRRLVVLAVAALTGMVMTPGSSYASGATISDGGSYHVLDFTYTDPANGAKHAYLPDWDVAANCTIYPDAEVVISQPDSAGHGWGAFHGTTFTNRRGAGEAWRGFFRILDSQGNFLASVSMDSAYMPQRYVAYTWDYYQPMFITPANFFFAAKVEWFGNCW